MPRGEAVITRPGNSVESLYVTLRERIVSGYYQPGTRLSQQMIAEDLSVSRTPIREALNRLESEGLVISQANRGMEVAPAALADVEDAYAIRLLVEPPIVANLVADVTDDDIQAMEDALTAMADPFIGENRYQEAHAAFHQVLLARYPDAVADLTNRLYLRITRHQRIYFAEPMARADFIQLDRAFLDAVRKREAARARQLLEFHLLDAAIGSILDVDAKYEFQGLPTSCQSIGLDVKGLQHHPAQRPIELRWDRPGTVSAGEHITHNLFTREH